MRGQDTAKSWARIFSKVNTGVGKGLSDPYAIAVDHGRLFVSNPGDRQISVFDIPRERFFQIGGLARGLLKEPMGLSVGRGGQIYVADAKADTIFVYDEQGKYLRSIGGPRWFSKLMSVAVDPHNERLYAIDRGQSNTHPPRIRVFDARDGHHLFDFGKPGFGPGELNVPYDLAVGKQGRLYVADSGSRQVEVFDRQGNYLTQLNFSGHPPGRFGRPKAIAVNSTGEVFVVDALYGKIFIFAPDGKYEFSIGGHGAHGEPLTYLLPASLAIDADGSLYFLDQGYKKIDIFRSITH